MPRQARLDTPGALHHVIGRGIDRTKVFRTDEDRADFLARLEALAKSGSLNVYAWSLMENHFHLLIRTGDRPLAQSMRKLLTGYAVNFNRRHRRYGHLFQNRYKSILCEEDAYLLELTRYIHLNPLRAGVVKSLEELAKYPWSGHGVFVGEQSRPWQDVESVLAIFGKRRGKAVSAYVDYVRAGIPLGRRPELVGGGLIRSLGGWSEVLSARMKGEKLASDQRILGSGDFIEKVWTESDKKAKEMLRGRGKRLSLEDLLRKISQEESVSADEIRRGDRRHTVVKARKRFSQIAVRELEYSGAAVARFTRVATTTVNRYARTTEAEDEKGEH